jgi:uncharacterized protein (DUF2141 family)
MAVFNYDILVTGDCQSNGTGIISILPNGGTPPYTVEWISPNLGSDVITLEPSVRTNLSAGDYALRLNDTTLPENLEFLVNIPVSNGVCCQILEIQNTTCDSINGSVTGTSSSDYSSTNFYLYDSDDVYVTSATTNTSEVIFDFLSAGTYYMVAEDLGGCTGKSETFIIQESTPFTYGLYVVPNSSCGGDPIGKIYVTGQTGAAPYQYIWNNNQTLTGSSITGLTAGVYIVEVTDSTGCVVSQSASVENVDPIGFGVFIPVNPSCLQNNGSLTLVITGGTAPYYYSASTGYFEISYSQTFTISDLYAGEYSIQVTDAGFCSILVGTSLNNPEGISSVSVDTVSSSCNVNDGKIIINLVGGTQPFTYTLIYPDGSTTNQSLTFPTKVFENLSTGTYTVGVSDANGCSFLEEVNLITENLFSISTSSIGTTCNQNNGKIFVTKNSGGTEPFTYFLDGVAKQINTNLTAVTYNNISSGQHTVSVSDASGCRQNVQVFVSPSEQLNFSLYSTSCGNGSEGTITALISSGNPPFTFNWSNNIAGNPQQLNVTGLSGGTYSLTIIDSNGCSLQRSTTISCNASYVSYQCYTMGSEVLQTQSPTKLGMLQMLNEGFFDLTANNSNCVLVSAEFFAKTSVQPQNTVSTQSFFVSNSLTSVPSDSLWASTIKNMLLSIYGVQSVTIDSINNTITITKSPTNTTLIGQEISVDVVIVYNILCSS